MNIADSTTPEQYVHMELFGKNLRKRGKQLGLTDAEVARLVGISERRYGFYVTGDRQPDLATLMRIANVLQITTDALLHDEEPSPSSEAQSLRDQIQAFASSMEAEHLELLAAVAKSFAAHAAAKAKSDANAA